MLNVKYAIFPLAFVSVGLLTGCAHYKAPKAAADLSVFSAQKATEVPPADAPPKPEGDVEFIDRKPMAKFPAHLVTVRVQESREKGVRNLFSFRLHYPSGDFILW